jgi:hypothetical protein
LKKYKFGGCLADDMAGENRDDSFLQSLKESGEMQSQRCS